jgi:hypothetical protein
MDTLSYFVKRLRGARDWPTTQATIQGCAWKHDAAELHYLAPYDWDRFLLRTGWYEVTYSYCIDGEYYNDDFIIPGDSHTDTPFHENDKITVGYNPNHPAQTYPHTVADERASAFLFRYITVPVVSFLLLMLVSYIWYWIDQRNAPH